MDNTYSAEQEALREVVRDFCNQHTGPASWKRLASELGLTGLAIDEDHGGMGGTLAEVAIAAEELARVLAPVPYLSTALAGAVLSRAPLSAGLLPELAAGDLTAAFTFGPSITITEGRLNGVAEHVLDGAEAGVFLVSAGGSLHAVRAADAEVRPTPTLDQTRSQATVTFRDSQGTDTGADPGHAEDLMRALLAAESVAAAGYCLEVTVDYLKTRRQFGRPIGTFQALKHRCADLAVLVASARAAAWAAITAQAGGEDIAVLAPLAKKYCADAFWQVAAEMVQLHGGIGFTWEHQAHRYLKRAKTTQLLHGSPAQLRRLVAERAGLIPAS